MGVEFDLNDRSALKKEKPARVGDDDSRLGPSSLQTFDGEDLGIAERVQRQQQQQRDFVIQAGTLLKPALTPLALQQAQEKQRRKEYEEELERLRVLREREVALRLRELELETEKARRLANTEARDFNRAMVCVQMLAQRTSPFNPLIILIALRR